MPSLANVIMELLVANMLLQATLIFVAEGTLVIIVNVVATLIQAFIFIMLALRARSGWTMARLYSLAAIFLTVFYFALSIQDQDKQLIFCVAMSASVVCSLLIFFILSNTDVRRWFRKSRGRA